MILDASVVFKWYVRKDEADTAKADLILKKFADGTETIKVPELLICELANALFYCKRLSVNEKEQAIVNFFNLGVEIIAVNQSDIISSLKIAKARKITIYDSVYLALANRLQEPLITANPKHQKFGKDSQVIFLKDYS